MLNCSGCGLTNVPYETACVSCRTPLQDEDAAAARRREWDALSPRLREEQEQAFVKMRASVEEHWRWLRRYRLVHAICGAALVNMPMNGSVFFASLWSIPVDLALGAGAALLLNRLRGGAWYGAGLFAAAAVASVVLRIPFLHLSGDQQAGWLLTCLAISFVVIGGYFMGMKLDYDHRDHFVTG